jgi:protein Mpv17
MFGIGMFLSAPGLHMWFSIMSRAIPKTDIASALKKVVLGQAIFAPIFNCAFFSVDSFIQGAQRHHRNLHCNSIYC